MTTNHKYFLDLAFQIAETNLGKTKLNPSVGTVVVKNNTVISSGVTSLNGRPHAEYNALKKIKKEGIKRIQVGLELDCAPLEKPNTTFWPIYKNGKKIGKVTSAVYSPRLKKNIALAMVEINHSEIGNDLKVISDNKEINSTIIEKPFYDPKKKIASS